MSSLSKGIGKVEVALRWDASPNGAPDHDLDLVAATYLEDDPYGRPDYMVHFDSRSPDGVIILNRDSRTGQGFGFDEVMTLELERLSSRYSRVVVGVVVQQHDGPKTFGEVPGTGVRIREGYTDLAQLDFSSLSDFTAATAVEFLRDEDEAWEMHDALRGFDTDPGSFSQLMGGD